MPPSKIVINTTPLKVKRLIKTLIQSSLDAADPNKAMKQSIIRK
jgi:hypothetical protein